MCFIIIKIFSSLKLSPFMLVRTQVNRATYALFPQGGAWLSSYLYNIVSVFQADILHFIVLKNCKT